MVEKWNPFSQPHRHRKYSHLINQSCQ